MLTVLLHSGVGDVCAVSTRYFGGTLLGKGGLVRAYSGGVKAALDGLPTVERVERATVTAVFAYSFVTPLRRLLPEYDATLVFEDFGQDVTLTALLPAERAPAFVAAITEVTGGGAIVEVTPAP
jgi:putative IMPACT (imprinted ancient) family translation regulator